MGLFRSKQETYAEATIAAVVERGLVARYLARILERGDLPLRGLLGVLRWINERRDLMSFPVPDELSNLLTQFYSGQFSYADLDRLYARDRETLISNLRQVADVPPDRLGFANLTPGDFAQARRQADMLGIAEDIDRVIALIAEISRQKPGSPRGSIGFVRQPQA